jgi:hypothetical protein
MTELVVEFTSSAYMTDTKLSRFTWIPGCGAVLGVQPPPRHPRWSIEEQHPPRGPGLGGVPDEVATAVSCHAGLLRAGALRLVRGEPAFPACDDQAAAASVPAMGGSLHSP